MASPTRTVPAGLIESAIEINGLEPVERALPTLVERARGLVGADSASAIEWGASLEEGLVRSAVGVGAERRGARVRIAPVPAAAVRSGRPQFGDVGPGDLDSELKLALAPLRRCVSVPFQLDGMPMTLQAAWAEELADDELAAAAETLETLASLTRIDRRAEGIADLGERRRFEQQLVQSGKLAAIGELSAGVAHEINNPLFAILGLVEFLLKDAEPGSKSHERLALVQQTALEIKEIVRALLDFARESSEERSVVALDEVVADTVALVRRTSANRGVETEQRFGAGPFLVHASPNQLKQIFLNLLANARQALPDGGTISIGLERRGDWIETTVRDSGDGIPADVLPRIFEPFFTTKRGAGGTGLGLSVSLGIAENHGGTLTAASEPGGGAQFTLRLPAHRA